MTSSLSEPVPAKPVEVSLVVETALKFQSQRAETFSLAQGTCIKGNMTVQPWLGPHEIQEYSFPSYYRVEFEFEFCGARRRYRGALGPFDLFVREGEVATESADGFIANVGPVEWLMDSRDVLSYRLPDGTQRHVRIKYTPVQFGLMVRKTELHVRCTYYEASDFANYRTIYYARSLQSILFRRAWRYSYDETGKIEDFDKEGLPFVEID